MTQTCPSCNAPLQSRFICVFCGSPTSAHAQTVDDEFELLAELNRAAQAITAKAIDASSNGLVKGTLSPVITARATQATAIFWQTAPIPRTPEALRHAAHEALAPIVGRINQQTYFGASPLEITLLARAESLIRYLENQDPTHSDVSRLKRQFADKKARIQHAKRKTMLLWLGIIIALAIGHSLT